MTITKEQRDVLIFTNLTNIFLYQTDSVQQFTLLPMHEFKVL